MNSMHLARFAILMVGVLLISLHHSLWDGLAVWFVGCAFFLRDV